MPAPDSKASELLRQEILEEARGQAEAIRNHARQKAEVILAEAEKEAEQLRADRMEAARAEVRRRTEAILATVCVEAGRMRSARIEDALQAIHDRARDELRARSGFDFPKVIAGLATEALGQMAGDAFELRLSRADRDALGRELVDEIRSGSSRSNLTIRLVADSNLNRGGLWLEDDTGRQAWNLSLEARLDRCWPGLRRQIAARAGIGEHGGA
ncbi:MAG TPA: V-type ATP synthase subunit E [Candidatus Paceibacterota bacterium]|nr:V-type ATP synthase subunit E [Candidatus Paceibacterota bacterium]HRZ54235.1 V-type ATP synthase subunit E [Candidatus Paceibacterota bacterium]